MELEEIRKSLSENKNVDVSLLEELNGIFSNILSMMDDRNFTRFVRNSKVSHLARNIIYELVDENKDKYLKEHPNVLGYHDKFVENGTIKQRIIVRKSDNPEIVKRYKGTGTHETIHALAAIMGNAHGGFGTFLGEGITQYLNELVNNFNDSDIYPDEVKTVKAAHKMFGDSFLIAYFVGDGANYFENILKTTLNDRDHYDARKRAIAMMKDFDIAAGEKGDGKEHTKEERKEALKRAQTSLVEHYVDYMKCKCENQEYFKGGRLDFDAFFKDVMPVVTSYYRELSLCDIEPIDLFRKLADNFYETSFFKTQIPGKEVDPEKFKDHVMSQLVAQFAREFGKIIEKDENGNSTNILPYRLENYTPFDTSVIYQYDIYEYNAAALQASTLMERAKIIKGDFVHGSFLCASVFLKSMATIIAQAERIDHNFLTEVAAHALGRELYTDYISEVGKFAKDVLPVLESYSLLEREYQESNSLFEYVATRLDAFPDSAVYAGVRDDKRVLIINDFDKARVSEISLENDEESRQDNFQNGIEVKIEDEQKGIFSITKDGKTSTIKIDRDTSLDSVEVLSGGFIFDDPTYNVSLPLAYLTSRIISDTAFHSLEKAVDGGEYVFRREKSEKSFEGPSKGISYLKLYRDLDAMRSISHTLSKDFTDAIIEELFEQTYTIDESKKNSPAAQIFEAKKELIKRNFNSVYMSNLPNVEPMVAALAAQNKELEELEAAIEKIPTRLKDDFFEGFVEMSLDKIGFSDIETSKKTMIEVEEEKDGEKKKTEEETL